MMKTWARFTETGASKGTVAETFTFAENPAALFPPEWVWVEAPAETVQGSTFGGKVWKHPAPASEGETPAPEPTYRLKLTPSEFRNAFSAFEEVAISDFAAARPGDDDASLTTLRKVVGVFFDRVRDRHLTEVDLGDPRNIAGLDLLVSVELLTKDRRDAIARGLPAS
ncbi:hypothetical protein NS226_13810 [Aureimonas ureilytica]|uniref:Uncharacterized protein n=1 Tax=Aureimonas ureilytica TaxID=401562 RepID=A0A175R6D0_9HYPH|nr:hypothetical protein [Aureimonas ureilytica]KTQ95002.1 hypothetical protein NS226_13810 [Aureimonas ureilytica]